MSTKAILVDRVRYAFHASNALSVVIDGGIRTKSGRQSRNLFEGALVAKRNVKPETDLVQTAAIVPEVDKFSLLTIEGPSAKTMKRLLGLFMVAALWRILFH